MRTADSTAPRNSGGGTIIDRSTPPGPSPPRSFEFPSFERHRLRNGLTLLAARVSRVPLAYLELIAPAGGLYQSEGTAGLASLTASLLGEGTENYSAVEIAASIENLGGSLWSGVDWNVASVASLVLSPHLDRGMALLAETVGRPIFPQEEIDRLRRKRLTELLRRRDQPAKLAADHFSRILFGRGVTGLPLLGTRENLGGFERGDVLGFYRRCYRRPGAALVVVGDIDLDALSRLAEEHLIPALMPDTGPGAGGDAALQMNDPPPRRGTTVHLIDRPGAAQTELRIGHVGVGRRHPDFLALTVLNSLLGGKFTSRINLNLRERHGFTYGAFSRWIGRLAAGPFMVHAAVATESVGAATREVLSELHRIRDEPVSEEELGEAKNYLVGVFPYNMQTIGEFADCLTTLATYGFPDDYFSTYGDEILAVDGARIQEVARRHIHPDRAAVVAVGPSEVLREQLADLGPMEVVEDPS